MMMTIVSIIFFIFGIRALGALFMRAVLGRESVGLIEGFGMAVSVGSGLLSWLFLMSSFAGWPANSMVLNGLLFAAIVADYFYVKLSRIPETYPLLPRETIERLTAFVGGLLIIYGLWQVSILALSTGITEWDGFAIWGLKAKILACEPLSPQPAYFTDATMSFSHLRYPLGVPALMAAEYNVLGGIDDRLGKFIFVLQYVALGCVVYAMARRRLGRGMSLMIAAIPLALPAMLRFGTSGTADLSVTLYNAAAVLCVVRWVDDKRAGNLGNLVVAGILAGSAMLAKNEGAVMAAACVFAEAIHALCGNRLHRFRHVALFAIVTALFILPWLWWSRGIPNTDEDYAGRVSHGLSGAAARLPEVLALVGQRLLRFDEVSFLPPALAVLAIVSLRALRDAATRTLWIILILHAAGYLLAYAITPWNIQDLMNATFARLLMHLTPVVAGCFAFHLAAVARPDAEDAQR